MGKPAPFLKGTSQMWTDDYISRQLLASHLDPQTDAASRRTDRIDATVHWIDSYLCRQDHTRTILDLGCGPGLYTQRLANLKYNVTGVDFSKLSIEYAKQQALSEELTISYINEDYIQYEYPDKYDLITMIYCDFGVLDELSRNALLSKIVDTLQPGGAFAFDIFRPQKYSNHTDSNTWSTFNGGFWREGTHLCLSSSLWYEEPKLHLDQYIILDEPNRYDIYNLWDKTYTVEEISSILANYGFVDLEFFNSFSGDPYTEEHDTLCVIARK